MLYALYYLIRRNFYFVLNETIYPIEKNKMEYANGHTENAYCLEHSNQ